MKTVEMLIPNLTRQLVREQRFHDLHLYLDAQLKSSDGHLAIRTHHGSSKEATAVVSSQLTDVAEWALWYLTEWWSQCE